VRSKKGMAWLRHEQLLCTTSALSRFHALWYVVDVLQDGGKDESYYYYI